MTARERATRKAGGTLVLFHCEEVAQEVVSECGDCNMIKGSYNAVLKVEYFCKMNDNDKIMNIEASYKKVFGAIYFKIWFSNGIYKE